MSPAAPATSQVSPVQPDQFVWTSAVSLAVLARLRPVSASASQPPRRAAGRYHRGRDDNSLSLDSSFTYVPIFPKKSKTSLMLLMLFFQLQMISFRPIFGAPTTPEASTTTESVVEKSSMVTFQRGTYEVINLSYRRGPRSVVSRGRAPSP